MEDRGAGEHAFSMGECTPSSASPFETTSPNGLAVGGAGGG